MAQTSIMQKAHGLLRHKMSQYYKITCTSYSENFACWTVTHRSSFWFKTVMYLPFHSVRRLCWCAMLSPCWHLFSTQKLKIEKNMYFHHLYIIHSYVVVCSIITTLHWTIRGHSSYGSQWSRDHPLNWTKLTFRQKIVILCLQTNLMQWFK